MAYTTINKSTTNFNTKLYTGTGSSNAVTGVGFKPDLVWLKKRSAADNHYLFDVVRGVAKYIRSNLNSGEATDTGSLSAFGSDGFTVVSEGDINANGATMASWNWKAGTSVSGNTTGSGTYKPYTGSVNTTSGFSIIRYTGNGSAGHTIPHRLGAAPTFRITKNTSIADWACYMEVLGNTKEMKLSTNAVAGNTTNYWNSTSPNATNFTLGTNGISNGNNENYISYNFAPKQGYSKFGSYKGNGNANGTFVYTGFKPAFVIIKRTDVANHWYMHDDKRLGYNSSNSYVKANENSAESTTTDIDILSNGFKCISTGNGHNNGSGTYFYMAIGQSLVGSNNIPCTAR